MMRQTPKRTVQSILLLLIIGFLAPLGFFPPFHDEAIAGPPSAQSGGHGPQHVPDEVLVRFAHGATGAEMAAAHAALGSSVARAFGLVPNLQHVKLAPGVGVKQAIQRYRQNPRVLYAEPNWVVQAVETTPNDTRFDELWGLKNTGQSGGTSDADIDATNAWDSTTGDPSVVVAVIDTGVDYTHPDLAANMFRNEAECNGGGGDDDGNGYLNDCYGYDFVNNDGNPIDDHNHGTHVAGTIGAVGNNSLGVVGVNWQVKIMACKFLNASGSGSIDAAIACMDYVSTMKGRGHNIIATSNSWGGGGFSQGLLDAIEAHRQQGILFVAAAGNDAADTDEGGFYPAGYFVPNVIAVAATTRADARASFSNWGRHTVHLGAPGAEILSTVRNNGYAVFNGTSMATPHVTGVAALIKARYPGAGWVEIKNRILAGSEDSPSMAGITITGKRLNAYGALTCSNSVVLARLTPVTNAVVGVVGTPIALDTLHINCTAQNGPVTVGVRRDTAPAGPLAPVTLQDPDGTGVYSGQWTPPDLGSYTLTFPNADTVQVHVLQPYAYAPTGYTYRSIAGASLNLGDDSTASITPGFPILFGGGSFATVFASSNGNLNFTAPFSEWANSSLTLPPASDTGSLVAPFWDDLFAVAGSAQNVFWQVVGSAPSRELVIEWRDVRQFACSGDTTATVRFQVVFFEGNSNILFNYADTAFGSGCASFDRGASATVGVQTGPQQATTFSLNSPSLSDGMALLWTLAGAPPPASPVLSVTPDPLNFGAVPVGTTKDMSFTVTNTGGGTLTGSASTTSPGFSVVGGASFSLAAGASQGVTVRFSPASAGLQSGTVAFTSNGGNSSPGVTGTGVAPSITVTSPNGGESWRVKSNRTITWSSTGIAGNVKIELFRNGALASTIASSTPNDGTHTWKVTGPAATQAQIRICSIQSPIACGVSGIFAIR